MRVQQSSEFTNKVLFFVKIMYRNGNAYFEAAVQNIMSNHFHTIQKYMTTLILSSVSKLHAGSFRGSVIHQTLTRATGSLMCIRQLRDHSYACICARVLGTPTASQHNIAHWVFSCAPDRVGTRVTDVITSWVQRSTHWATLSPCHPCVGTLLYMLSPHPKLLSELHHWHDR